MRKTALAIDAAKAQGGVVGAIKKVGLIAAAGVNFARLYFHPVVSNTLPAQVRLVPVW
jgi:magnesium-protoporphyrin IX monomethyl ester (oxidative) cyclase